MVRQTECVRFVRGIDRCAAGEVETRQSLLIQIDLDRPIDLAQAAAASLSEGRLEPSVDQQAPIRPREAQFALQVADLD